MLLSTLAALVITADGATPRTALDLPFAPLDLVVDDLEGLPGHFLVNAFGSGRRGVGVRVGGASARVTVIGEFRGIFLLGIGE